MREAQTNRKPAAEMPEETQDGERDDEPARDELNARLHRSYAEVRAMLRRKRY
jgi:hypothetical protein